jgi:hypothetical protein
MSISLNEVYVLLTTLQAALDELRKGIAADLSESAEGTARGCYLLAAEQIEAVIGILSTKGSEQRQVLYEQFKAAQRSSKYNKLILKELTDDKAK